MTRCLPALLVLLTTAAAAARPAGAAGLDRTAPAVPDLVRSTVGVDRRTNRLVRRVIVPENVVEARLIAPRPMGPDARPVVLAPNGGDERIASLVDEVAEKNGVDPLLVHSIIHVESRYNRFALSPKGAEGLMQLIPSTARRMGVSNSFDTRQNIEGGVRYLRQLLDRFDDLRHVLAAYNAGENAVERYRGIPPYAETQDYVWRVGQRYGQLRRTYKDTARAPAPAAPAVEPEYRPLESYVGPDGRLHMRTR